WGPGRCLGAPGMKLTATILRKAAQDTHTRLQCPEDPSSWEKDNVEFPKNLTELDLGPIVNDPRGVYKCSKDGTQYGMKVHVRMCQNCIELDVATISGIVIADIIATIFLAIAVYCITGQERGHLSRGEERGELSPDLCLSSQPLGERDDGHYSRLGVTRTRK
uniref:CD3 gamma/delta subunit Ig-like domain-containing protein n=1 Tax=Crocodylus porosus TaxID=8502 RepID=A0A7M4DUZ1_CROPO